MSGCPNLFDIAGVTKQREIQCDKCPDSREKVTLPERLLIQPHRCHSTIDALCAGPNRPRILSQRGI